MDTAITHGESVMHFLPVKRWFGHQKCDTLQYWRSYRPTTSISCVCPGLSESVYWKCPQPPQKCQKPAKKPEIIFYTHVLRQYLCYAHQKTFFSFSFTRWLTDLGFHSRADSFFRVVSIGKSILFCLLWRTSCIYALHSTLSVMGCIQFRKFSIFGVP